MNNTSATIDFVAKPHVLDDKDGNSIAGPNVTSGAIAVGQLGILFNAAKLSVDDMATIWGPGNYIPVTSWPALNNSGGDLVALWDNHGMYMSEAIDEETGRGYEHAVAAVRYNTVAGQGWPTLQTGRSIYMKDLTADPSLGTSWTRTGTATDTIDSFNAQPLMQQVFDHPGDDIGSPGSVPAVAPVGFTGDYNSDGRVDAADYTVWRNSIGNPGATLANRDSANTGPVGIADYNSWKARYGDSLFGNGGLAGLTAVPEPASGTMTMLAMCAALVHRAQRRRS